MTQEVPQVRDPLPTPPRHPALRATVALCALAFATLVTAGWAAWAGFSTANSAETAALERRADALAELVATCADRDDLAQVLERALAGSGYAAITVEGEPSASAGDPALSASRRFAERSVQTPSAQSAAVRVYARDPANSRWINWIAAPVAAIGVLAVCAFTARLLVRELGALASIRTALQAFSAGERSAGALAAGIGRGGLADAWNSMLDWIDEARAEAQDHAADEALRASREGRGELRDACDALWIGLIVLDQGGSVRYANGAAAALLGLPGQDLASRQAADLTTDDAVSAALRDFARGATRQRQIIESDRRSIEGDGGVLRFSIRPSRRDDTVAGLVLIEDITQHRVAESARSAFVTQAAHELRTPLTNIRLYIEELIDEDGESGEVTEDRKRALNVINQETRRLERIVADMLSMSEIEAGQLSIRHDDVAVMNLLTDLQADFEAQARERGITLTLDLPPKLPTIKGDRDKIGLALHNLAGNALKYTERGGAVTITAQADAETVRIDVNDTGIGINADDAERVFEKFVRARDTRIESVPGTGLGLALAREVTRLHGGDVTLVSEVDHGSTFTITLPANGRAAA